jgi:signal transduction histidine kinase
MNTSNITDNISVEKTGPESNSVLSLIQSIGANEMTEGNFEAALTKTIEAVVSYLGADHGYIMLKGKAGQLACVAKTSADGQTDTPPTVGNALVEKVMQTASVVIVNDAMQSPDFPSDPDFQRFNINTALCAPIKTGQTPTGVLYIDSTSQCRWDNNHLELIRFLALHLAMAVNNATLEKQTAENKRLIATGNAALKLSHSVKNILQMIGGAVEVIDFGLRTNQIHRVKRSWDILKPNLARMKKYTLEMLDYSKERKLKLEPCDFNRVIQGAIESLKAQLKAKKSKLNIRIDRDMPTVELDSERIHEMALNLILNAIDIVDENTGIVSVETKYLADEQTISVDVTDNGPGITDDMKEKIFTPFESDKNKFGTGLGMPIAKQIVDQHGGHIDIETVKGKGTTFQIILPAILVGKNP